MLYTEDAEEALHLLLSRKKRGKNMSKKWKILLISVVGLIVLGLGVAAVSSIGKKEAASKTISEKTIKKDNSDKKAEQEKEEQKETEDKAQGEKKSEEQDKIEETVIEEKPGSADNDIDASGLFEDTETGDGQLDSNPAGDSIVDDSTEQEQPSDSTEEGTWTGYY